MAVNEEIVLGRFFRKMIDVTTKKWQRISFWHKASDCEFNDGKNAEVKLGAIKGITSDTNVTTTGYAADMMAVKELNNSLTAGAEHFYYDIQNGIRGFNTSAARGADTFIPFKGNAEFKLIYSSGNILGTALSYTYTVPKGITELIAYFTTKSGAASPVYAVFPDNYYARNNLHANFGADIIFYHVKEGDVMSFSIAANTNQWRYLDVYVA